MLHLGRLKVLSEVVSKGSFSAAAESLSYTQSAVSQAIARLESEIGTTLLVRDRRGVRATPAGATLVAHAEEIFGRVEAAESDLAAVLGVRSGRLRVADDIANQPIAMRVMVNRIWKGHFDTGIVDTPSNFGQMGERPTNPELLEYLASTFVKDGLSKAMLRNPEN